MPGGARSLSCWRSVAAACWRLEATVQGCWESCNTDHKPMGDVSTPQSLACLPDLEGQREGRLSLWAQQRLPVSSKFHRTASFLFTGKVRRG